MAYSFDYLRAHPRINPNRHVVLETLTELEADTPGTIRDSFFCPQFLMGRAVIDYGRPFASAVINEGRLQRVWVAWPEAVFLMRAFHEEELKMRAREAVTA